MLEVARLPSTRLGGVWGGLVTTHVFRQRVVAPVVPSSTQQSSDLSTFSTADRTLKDQM